MSNQAIIIGDSGTRIWGLAGRERLERALRSVDARIVADPRSLPAQEIVLLLRGDWIYDVRLLRALLAGEDDLILSSGVSGPVIAVRTHAPLAVQLLPDLDMARRRLPGARSQVVGDLVCAYEESLRKFDPPQVHPIRAENREQIEADLFGGAYKGVTDLVTKWLWPVPASHATHLCVRLGLSPNHVTLTGLVLAVLAGVAFWNGAFGLGLVLAWMMTFLDTVDGKLARVTITSSRLGDVLDHGLDLLHPPLWYAAWGFGVADTLLSAPLRDALIWIIVAAYIAGRLCEGAFQLWAGPFSLFIWKPFDSWNRLITARRNPNLILLTLLWLAARPDVGLMAVAAWHAVSTLILALRLRSALRERSQKGQLQPWLADIDPVADRARLEVRIFTRAPPGPESGGTSAR